MKLSVALCTYNGAAFLGAQLDSLAAQSRPPDELVVSDDHSGDATAVLVEAFAAKAPFPVRLQVNDANLGFAQNFGRAVSLCAGELVALSDQDDVWVPTKLARLESRFIAEPDVGLVCSDAEIVDRELRPVGQRLWESIGTTAEERARVASGHATSVLLEHNIAMGAATAFRARFRDAILPIPPGWHHDWWIALVVSLHARLALIDEPLVLYRQHGGNQLGAPETAAFGVEDLLRSSTHPRTAEFVAQEIQWRGALERVEELSRQGSVTVSPGDLASLRRKIRHLHARASLPVQRRRRVAPVAGELFRWNYHRYSAGVASAVKDLFVPQIPAPGPATSVDPGSGSG